MIYLSVLVPVWNNEKEILLTHERISNVLSQLEYSYEILFIDDGSKDNSFHLLGELHRQDPHISLLKLTRNYGQSPALTAGMEHARGKFLLTLDVDLAGDPKEIPRFLAKIEEGWDLVSGWRIQRLAPLLSRRVPSFFMNQISSMLTGVRLNDYGCGMNVFTKDLASRIREHHEKCCFLKPLAVQLSQKTTEIKIRDWPTAQLKSSYSTLQLLKLMLDLITTFTVNSCRQPTAPLYRVEKFIEASMFELKHTLLSKKDSEKILSGRL